MCAVYRHIMCRSNAAGPALRQHQEDAPCNFGYDFAWQTPVNGTDFSMGYDFACHAPSAKTAVVLHAPKEN